MSRDLDVKSKLTRLCNLNSGTCNQPGVRAVAEVVIPWFREIADRIERVALPDHVVVDDFGTLKTLPMADAIVFRRREHAQRQVLLGIHLDTVYGLDHPFQSVTHPEPNLLRGPGVADAKGGVMVLLSALWAFESRVAAGDIDAASVGWTVFLNPDEEIGSPSSWSRLTQLARQVDFAMVYEPALPDGTMIRARKGSGNFDVVVRGRSAHAGREIDKGRNAVAALCRLFGSLEELHQSDGSVTVNLGRIIGGGPVNVVPNLAIGRWNVRVVSEVKCAWLEDQIQRCVADANQADGITVELHGGMTSPPKPFDQRTGQLFSQIADVAHAMGLTIPTAESGGVCDGNKLAAAGCPTVDTLGPIGGNLHSDQEYVLMDSIDTRARLSESILVHFAHHPERFPLRP